MEPPAKSWWALAMRGVAAIIFGVLTLLLPGVTLAGLILLFGSYAIVEGVFNVIAAVWGRGSAGEGVAAAAASPTAAGCGRSEQRYGFHAPSTSQ